MERRKHKRFKLKLLITTVYKDEAGSLVSEDSVFSEDISAGGMRIVFPHHIPRGKILDLKVFLFSDPIHLSAQGLVAWSSKKVATDLADGLSWVGIQFIDVDAFTRERIFRWIKKEFNVKKL